MTRSSAGEKPALNGGKAAQRRAAPPPGRLWLRPDIDWFHFLETQVRQRLTGDGHIISSLFSAYHSGMVGKYERAGALFYAIPKNASSTLHLLLLYAEGMADEKMLQDRDYRIYRRLDRLKRSYMRTRYYVTGREKRRLLKFSFVRNPWDRLFSFYRDKIARPDSQFLDHNLRRHYPDVAFRGMEFPDFVRFAHQLPAARMEPHFLPQHYFFRPRKMDFIGRVEDLGRDLERLTPLLSPPARQRIRDAEIPQLKKTGTGRYAEAYDDETRRLAERRYARDIELFGYRFGD